MVKVKLLLFGLLAAASMQMRAGDFLGGQVSAPADASRLTLGGDMLAHNVDDASAARLAAAGLFAVKDLAAERAAERADIVTVADILRVQDDIKRTEYSKDSLVADVLFGDLAALNAKYVYQNSVLEKLGNQVYVFTLLYDFGVPYHDLIDMTGAGRLSLLKSKLGIA